MLRIHFFHLLQAAASFLPLMLIAACTSSQNSGSTAVPTQVTLTDANNGQTVELRTRQMLVISLKGNLTTGYSWAVSDTLPFLQAQGDPEYKPDSNAVGASGVFTLRFKLTGSGNGRLMLAYRRPFETGVAPIQTYSVQVNAR